MPSSTISSEPARVLLVDDNEAVLSRVATVLKPCCHIVGTATNGRTALVLAAALKPDVIVLDISMAGMTGFDVVARLRQAGSTSAIVFLTVQQDPEVIDAAREAGVIGYVVKPRLVTDLRVAIQEARQGRSFVSQVR
jgi:DNA-binding NarL/FixJ family response regulator